MRGIERGRTPEGLFDPGPSRRVSPARRLRERRLRRRRRAVGALLILAVGGAAAWFAFSGGDASPGPTQQAPDRADRSERLGPAGPAGPGPAPPGRAAGGGP